MYLSADSGFGAAHCLSCVHTLRPGVFPQPSPFPTLVHLLFAGIAASPREWWFLLSQRFLPPLSLYIQDVSFRKHEPTPLV